MNIVIPMAGAGSRFINAGYELPKPLIPIHGTPMIRVVIENLRPRGIHRFIFICQREHIKKYTLEDKLRMWAPGSALVEVNGLTEGAACTVLAAKAHIDSDTELMIANSDQYIDADINSYLEASRSNQLDGIMMTMQASDPKWSFVETTIENLVTRVVEKEVISDQATVGIYNFRKGRDFVRSTESMISKNLRVNGEFYVAPVYNQLIKEGKRIGTYNIGSESAGMHGLGTPLDFIEFTSLDISRKAAKAYR